MKEAMIVCDNCKSYCKFIGFIPEKFLCIECGKEFNAKEEIKKLQGATK
jgi:DNA-directed RNA polymerase subunit RPC12/RpoP